MHRSVEIYKTELLFENLHLKIILYVLTVQIQIFDKKEKWCFIKYYADKI